MSDELASLAGAARDPDTGQLEDLAGLLYRWALESITAVFLGHRLGCLAPNPTRECQELVRDANTVLGPDMYRLATRPPLWRYCPTPSYIRLNTNKITWTGNFR